jgi:hypothetical protein
MGMIVGTSSYGLSQVYCILTADWDKLVEEIDEKMNKQENHTLDSLHDSVPIIY